MKKIYHTSNCFKRFENYLKFSLVSLAILFTALPANATADGTKLTLSFKDSNLPAILKEIKNQTKYDFMYNSKEIDTNKRNTRFRLESLFNPFRANVHDQR